MRLIHTSHFRLLCSLVLVRSHALCNLFSEVALCVAAWSSWKGLLCPAVLTMHTPSHAPWLVLSLCSL